MKGVSLDALSWALDQLRTWAEHEPPGIRVKQVIYRLLLLRELGATKQKPSAAFSSGDFRDHCARFLRVSDGSLTSETGGKSRHFVPTTCDWALAEDASDWAVGTMWTRCQTWQRDQIISWPGESGPRRIRFKSDYVAKLRGSLSGTALPGLPLALFLLRNPAATKINIDSASTPQDLIDIFRKTFNLDDKEIEQLIDFSVDGYPTPTVVDNVALTDEQILALLKQRFPLVDHSEKHDESATESNIDSEFLIRPEERKGISKHPLQVLVHGCPGTGKSHLLKAWAASLSRSFTVVFHPETTYGDFVGVYRPRSIYREADSSTFVDEAGRVREHGDPYITYEFVPGPLLRAYCAAWTNPNESVALIIEELSRGNASLAFGDTLQLLDRAEGPTDGLAAGASTYEVHPRSEIAAYLARHNIPLSDRGVMRFPSNLHIWATMNRSDQNARQLDAAFLRRWDKRHLSYSLPCSYGSRKLDVPGGEMTWDDLRMRINATLEGFVSEDKFVGPYFLTERRLSDPRAVAEDLLGYLWNDVLKSRAKDVFAFPTFTDALEAWASGKKNPFRSIAVP